MDLVESLILDGEPCRVGFLDGVPGAVERALLDELGVDGIHIFFESTPAPDALSWLAELPRLRLLTVDSKICPAIPLSVLQSLESLTIVSGRCTETVDLASLGRARVLEFAASAVRGHLHEVPALEALALRSYPFDDLGVLDGCGQLRQASLNGRGRDLSFQSDDPPPHLEQLQAGGLWPISMDGIDHFAELKRLMVSIGKSRTRATPLDLAPIARCPRVEVVTLANIGPYINHEVVDSLPTLKTLRLI